MPSNKTSNKSSSKQTQQNAPISPVVIDSGGAMRINKGNSTLYEKSLMSRNDIWHKIQVFRGGLYDKEQVLKSILIAVSPNDLIPIKYTVTGEDSYFLVRNCDSALQQLCRSNLIIKNIAGELLLLTITLGYASIHDLKINIRPLLLALLTNRFNHRRKSLILDNFHRDPEISQTVYCPLFQHRTFTSVLNIANKDLPPFEYLSLQYNDLNNLSGIETTNVKTVKSLDLRHNNLINADSLALLKNLNITELWLDSNPLCENYFSSKQYIESIRQYCPTLSRLDGIYIGSPGLPIICKVYINNRLRQNLVMQFIDHFFTLYDERDRGILKGLYHKTALYSMTLDITFATHIKKQAHINDKRFTVIVDKQNTNEEVEKKVPYIMGNENRNLFNKQVKDATKFLYYGEDEILKVLRKLPETQHFRDTFSYDLVYDDVDCLTITVDGTFRDKYDERFLFSRTFILTAGNEGEYNIINDQYLVYCTSTKDLQISKDAGIKKYIADKNMSLHCLSLGEKEQLIANLKKITTMNDKFCKRFLDEADWNIRKAIIDFVIQFKAKYIPTDAFIK